MLTFGRVNRMAARKKSSQRQKKTLAVRAGFSLLETLLALSLVGTLAATVSGLVKSSERFIEAYDAEREVNARQLMVAMSNHIYSTQSTRDLETLPTTPSKKHLCRQGQTHANCVNLDVLATSGQLTVLPYDEVEECPSFSGYEVYFGAGNRPQAIAEHTGKLPGDAPESAACNASNDIPPPSSPSDPPPSDPPPSDPPPSDPPPPAEVAIDSSVYGSPEKLQRTPTVVFTSALIGYVFYTDNNDTCVYGKTSDGGLTWGGAVQVTAQTDCLGIVAWYDRWTPGDTTGNSIHLLYVDSSDNDLWYRALNTSTDAFVAAEVNTSDSPGSNQGGSFENDNRYSITKATNGTIYIGVADGGDSFILKCATTCETTANWAEAGTSPLEEEKDDLRLLPLASGNIILINWHIDNSGFDANTLFSKVWNGSSWSGSWTTIGTGVDNDQYLSAWGATVNRSTNDVYLVWNND